MKIKLNFPIYNKSDLFFKHKIRLELLQAIYGDNATAEDIKKKNEEIKGAKRKWKTQLFVNLWNDLQTPLKSLLNNTCIH